jgi:hypothetical protein
MPRWCSVIVPVGVLLAGRALAQGPLDVERPRFALPADQRTATALGFEAGLTGPALIATTDDLHLRLLVARAARDTALVRATLRRASETYALLGRSQAPPPVLLAETEAWLGDSGAALARMRAFESRRAAMDTAVRWDDVPNGALLARADSARARLEAPTPHAAAAGRIAFPRRGEGAWRWRYDAEIRTRLPFAAPVDTIVPIARVALIVDEALVRNAAALELRTGVRGVALDLPLLSRVGDEGLLYLRTLVTALRSGGTTARVGADGDVVGHRAIHEAAGFGAGTATSLLQALGPLAFAPRLPAESLAVGATWTDTVRVAAPGTALGDAAIPLPATVRLTDIRAVEGRTLAVLALDADVRAWPIGRGLEHADITLSGEIVLDAGDGLPVRTAASLRASVVDGRGARTPVRALVTALRQTAPAIEGRIASR